MRVLNIHSRTIAASAAAAGALLDSVSSRADRLWPVDSWPPLRFDRPLQVGATGGHGPIRYTVESYTPGREITFRFLAPRGFDGTHAFSVSTGPAGVTLTHTLAMDAVGIGILSWSLVLRPLHDALLEDALAGAECRLTGRAAQTPWPLSVRILRWLLRRQPVPFSSSSRGA